MPYTSVLNSKVLVLNSFFAALHVVTVRSAFTLLCKERAEVISVDDGAFNSHNLESWRDVSIYKMRYSCDAARGCKWVRTFSFDIEVPKIIRLLVYSKFPRKDVKFNRKNVFARDKNTCQYCGRIFPTSELSLEHILPKSRGGKNDWLNIVCACARCNRLKGRRTPKEAGMRLIRKPEAPTCNPVVNLKLLPEKWDSWENFVDDAYWSVPLR